MQRTATWGGQLDINIADAFQRILCAHGDHNTQYLMTDVHEFMPGGVKAANPLARSQLDGLRARLLTQHLYFTVVSTLIIPGHFIFARITHAPPTITLCDPLGTGAAATRRRYVDTLLAWLANERSARKLPPRAYAVCYNTAYLPMQNDAISCGWFCLSYMYFLLVHDRWPTTADFTGINHKDLRVAIYDIVTNNRVRPVLAVGGAAGPAGGVGGGAGAGAEAGGAGAGAGGGGEPPGRRARARR